ncbi:IpaC/SipC family type III secretion system effector [Candidatus Fukatsuia symbiotica]|uniref:Uncharacterized protein n=1 Tax=Candidatus Fukatsuia symbiotica TaxID=1878942 RepID=A0A2U8I571_9GAMM|nr:IpaC/SipC family type III secretion system effector [Candidatus Fukatsuia symbiotica]AWK14316.1 hypothetical protein CCS41_07265 [Candidatus Fukatsuia symbiotica]MEA9444573.1 IpaC/SipC family type III secretion system effector [Candidatus Fukatsuia symbiotica]
MLDLKVSTRASVRLTDTSHVSGTITHQQNQDGIKTVAPGISSQIINHATKSSSGERTFDPVLAPPTENPGAEAEEILELFQKLANSTKKSIDEASMAKEALPSSAGTLPRDAIALIFDEKTLGEIYKIAEPIMDKWDKGEEIEKHEMRVVRDNIAERVDKSTQESLKKAKEEYHFDITNFSSQSGINEMMALIAEMMLKMRNSRQETLTKQMQMGLDATKSQAETERTKGRIALTVAITSAAVGALVTGVGLYKQHQGITKSNRALKHNDPAAKGHRDLAQQDQSKLDNNTGLTAKDKKDLSSQIKANNDQAQSHQDAGDKLKSDGRRLEMVGQALVQSNSLLTGMIGGIGESLKHAESAKAILFQYAAGVFAEAAKHSQEKLREQQELLNKIIETLFNTMANKNSTDGTIIGNMRA